MAIVERRQRTPWHLWLIGGLALLWNGFGAFDFTMTSTRGAEYLRSMGMGEAMVTYMQGLPAWLYVLWGIGVWGGVLGAVSLLLRRRWAVLFFGFSLIGAIASQVVSNWVYVPPATGGAMTFMPYVIMAIAAALLLYARAMSRKAVIV